MRVDSLPSALLARWGNDQVRNRLDVVTRVLTDCSPKFFRKILYVETLSELAYHVPITQIDIPPAVYKYVPLNVKHHIF